MHEQGIGKPSQAILMSNHDSLNLPGENGVNQAQKVLALEIHAPADFGDPLIHLDALPPTILF
jgi:hypothetical protein